MPTKAHAQAVDLDDRLRVSTALEREASGRSALQATSLAALETRAFNSSSPSNGIMMIASDSLCVRVFRPSHRVIRCCFRPFQHHHHPLIVRSPLNGSRHPRLPQPRDSSRSGSKYGLGDKYKTIRFSDKVHITCLITHRMRLR